MTLLKYLYIDKTLIQKERGKHSSLSNKTNHRYDTNNILYLRLKISVNVIPNFNYTAITVP